MVEIARRKCAVGLTSDWKERSPIFFIDRSDAPKYDIIWSENENLIDQFIPEILMLKVCPTQFKPKNGTY